MDLFHQSWADELIFTLGILNIVLGVLVFSSCRCIPMAGRIGQRIMRHASYQRFYRMHCALWPLLCLSVILHAVFAIGYLGLPN